MSEVEVEVGRVYPASFDEEVERWEAQFFDSVNFVEYYLNWAGFKILKIFSQVSSSDEGVSGLDPEVDKIREKSGACLDGRPS